MADPYSIPPVPPRSAGGASVLDKDVAITGTITTEGAIRIEGKVDGEVEARSVTLAKGAVITGGVVADVAVIEGKLVGPLHAREARLTQTAHMEGEVVHSILIIEAGAYFEGECRRQAAAGEGTKAKSASTPPLLETAAPAKDTLAKNPAKEAAKGKESAAA